MSLLCSRLQNSAVCSSVCYFTILFLQGFHCFIIYFLHHCSVLSFNCPIFCFLRHYTTSSRFPLFHYLFVTSMFCSWLRLSPLLFATSLYYFFKLAIVSLSICYVIALLSALIIPS